MLSYVRLAVVRMQLNYLRGRRTARVLVDDDLLQVLDEARRDGIGWRAGDTVAHSYSYPASRMRIAAIRHGGSYLVRADWGHASDGCSPLVGGGRQSVVLREWSALRRRPLREVAAGWWRVRASEVRTALAARRVEAARTATARYPEPPTTLVITLADSLTAGNCLHESERIAAWYPGESAVQAARLRQDILDREPALAAYAARAQAAALARDERS